MYFIFRTLNKGGTGGGMKWMMKSEKKNRANEFQIVNTPREFESGSKCVLKFPMMLYNQLFDENIKTVGDSIDVVVE